MSEVDHNAEWIETKENTFQSLDNIQTMDLSTYGSCLIDMGKKAVLTGGAEGARSNHDVIEYDSNFNATKLPDLNHGRRDHACGFFYENPKDDESPVYIVTG